MVLSMTGHQNLTARILALGAVLNVLLNLVLVPRLGLEGGAVATTVALAAWNAMAVWAVWSRLGLGATAFSWSRRTTRDGG